MTKRKAAAAAAPAEISQYELARLQRIERNQEFMKSLGLENATVQAKKQQAKKRWKSAATLSSRNLNALLGRAGKGGAATSGCPLVAKAEDEAKKRFGAARAHLRASHATAVAEAEVWRAALLRAADESEFDVAAFISAVVSKNAPQAVPEDASQPCTVIPRRPSQLRARGIKSRSRPG